MLTIIKVWVTDQDENDYTKDFHCHFVPRAGDYIIPDPFANEIKVEKVVHMMDYEGLVHVHTESVEFCDGMHEALESGGWELT